MDFPYTRDELDALFTLAYEEDVEYDGRYDTWNAAITLWTQAWPHPWTELAIEDSLPKGTLHFAWGQPPGLWLIEVDGGFGLAHPLQELGRLELTGLGYPNAVRDQPVASLRQSAFLYAAVATPRVGVRQGWCTLCGSAYLRNGNEPQHRRDVLSHHGT